MRRASWAPQLQAHNPGGLFFGDLRLQLAAATMLEVEGVEVHEELHANRIVRKTLVLGK